MKDRYTHSFAALTRSFNDPSQLVNKNRTHSPTMKCSLSILSSNNVAQGITPINRNFKVPILTYNALYVGATFAHIRSFDII